MPTRSPARRPGRQRRQRRQRRHRVGAVATLTIVLCGLVLLLAGTGVAELNEPTVLPEVSQNLIVLSRGELLGSRVLAAGAVLLALGAGYHLGSRAGARRPRKRR